jgi:Tfp pilus assembly protein PilX
MTDSNMRRSLSAGGRERGAVLIVALLILFAMTLIGVSSMDSAVMELKMSGTMQQQIVAMNRAEATLLTAEARIEAITNDGNQWNFETSKDGFYGATNTLDLEQANWDKVSTEAGPNDSDNNVDDDDAYVIEYLGAKTPGGDSAIEDPNPVIAGGAVHTFRNTTRSASGRSVVRIVQSIYVTNGAP